MRTILLRGGGEGGAVLFKNVNIIKDKGRLKRHDN